MKIKLKGRLRGVNLPKRKDTSMVSIEKLPVPKEVVIPMNMHLGKPAKVIVEEGQLVQIGTLIGKKEGLISANIHSSVSGKIKKIEERQIGNMRTTVVVIENDFSERISPSILESTYLEDIIADKGIVGMGGAGFPTDVKFLLKEGQKIERLIINAAECEPFVTADQRLILENTDSFLSGIQLVLDTYNIPKATIAVEGHSKAVIAHLEKSISDERIGLKILPNHYPQGAEKLVLKNVLGKELPLGKLPIDLGAVILNVSTVTSIYQTVKKDLPLIERVVTVSGSPMKEKKNLLVRIGTPVEYLIDACGGFIEPPSKLLNGGPMMGKLISSLNEPVTKTTNLILALNATEANIPKEQACIRCSECVNACPVGLAPILISRAYRNNDLEGAEQLGALSCIECGGCSYICPSKIDLLADIRKVKRQIMETKR